MPVCVSGGNFHGEYPAKALDFLAIGVHELAAISERRIERLCNPTLSGTPPSPVPHPLGYPTLSGTPPSPVVAAVVYSTSGPLLLLLLLLLLLYKASLSHLALQSVVIVVGAFSVFINS